MLGTIRGTITRVEQRAGGGYRVAAVNTGPLDLRPYGYAPGAYVARCQRCERQFTGADKQAVTCITCALMNHVETLERKLAKEEQPKPERKDASQPVAERLKALIDQRTAKGVATYGTPLMSHNGRNAQRDALEESVDLNQYLMQVVIEAQHDRDALANAVREAISSDGEPNVHTSDYSLADLRALADRVAPASEAT